MTGLEQKMARAKRILAEMPEVQEHAHDTGGLRHDTKFGVCKYDGPVPGMTCYYIIAKNPNEERHYWDGENWNNDPMRRYLWSWEQSAIGTLFEQQMLFEEYHKE